MESLLAFVASAVNKRLSGITDLDRFMEGSVRDQRKDNPVAKSSEEGQLRIGKRSAGPDHFEEERLNHVRVQRFVIPTHGYSTASNQRACP